MKVLVGARVPNLRELDLEEAGIGVVVRVRRDIRRAVPRCRARWRSWRFEVFGRRVSRSCTGRARPCSYVVLLRFEVFVGDCTLARRHARLVLSTFNCALVFAL